MDLELEEIEQNRNRNEHRNNPASYAYTYGHLLQGLNAISFRQGKGLSLVMQDLAIRPTKREQDVYISECRSDHLYSGLNLQCICIALISIRLKYFNLK